MNKGHGSRLCKQLCSSMELAPDDEDDYLKEQFLVIIKTVLSDYALTEVR